LAAAGSGSGSGSGSSGSGVVLPPKHSDHRPVSGSGSGFSSGSSSSATLRSCTLNPSRGASALLTGSTGRRVLLGLSTTAVSSFAGWF